ncbi:SCF ubiquitin ligase complex subunit cdc4 [Binucleata daphniae]
MIGDIEETRAEIHTNQVDITQISRNKNKIFVSSDDQTVKMFEICNDQENDVCNKFMYDGHVRKRKSINKEDAYVGVFDRQNTDKHMCYMKNLLNKPKINNNLFSSTHSVFVGHQGGVWTFDHNDKYLVTGSTDKTVRIWSIENCMCMYVLKGHKSTIRCLKIADDIIISGSRDSEIRIWNFNGECLHVLKAHTLSVRCLDVLDKYLLTGSYDGSVLLWDYKHGKKLKVLKRHIQRVYAVKITEKYIISAGQCSNIYVSDRQGNLKHVLKEHKSVVVWLEVVGNFLLSAGADGNIVKWNLCTGEKEYQILERKHTTALKYYNGCILVASSQNLNMYDLKNGRFIKCLLTNYEAINALNFDEHGILAGCKKDGMTKIVSITYKQMK